MPFKKETVDPDGEITGLKFHKQILKQLVRDTTLISHRRFQVELLLMWLSSSGRKKTVIEGLMLGSNFGKLLDGRVVKTDPEAEPENKEENILDFIKSLEG
jgi:hypothetical protein